MSTNIKKVIKKVTIPTGSISKSDRNLEDNEKPENDNESDTGSDTNKNSTLINISHDKNEIQYIYHISDVHIRNTQRHAEYKDIFYQVYEKLKKKHQFK